MKIFDTFMFHNEIDILRLRVGELRDVVDRFIIAECNVTHTGNPREYEFPYYEEEIKCIANNTPITYIKVDDCPPANLPPKFAWAIENHHRNALRRGIPKLGPNDLILLSDVDEIPRPSIIQAFRDLGGSLLDEHLPLVLMQKFFYYSFMYEKPHGCHGTIVIGAKCLKSQPELQWYRDNRFRLQQMQLAGWHLSFFGSVEHIANKIGSIAHTEFNTTENKDRGTIAMRVLQGQDIYGRKGPVETLIPNKDLRDLPKYFLENRDKFEGFLPWHIQL